jgi:hypothetical protein
MISTSKSERGPDIKIRWFSGVLKNAERNCQRYHIAVLLFVLLINNGYASFNKINKAIVTLKQINKF